MTTRFSRPLIGGPGTCVWLCLLLFEAMPAGASEERFDCLIEPTLVSEVGSQVQGVIAELLVERGERVTRGQAIAHLDSTLQTHDLKQATERAATRGEIIARNADLALARLEMERMKQLYDDRSVPSQERDRAVASYQVASAALQQARDNLALMQREQERADQLLALRTLRSPVTGVVVEHLSHPGEFVYDNPVMTIAQIDPLRIEVVLPGKLFNHYRKGDKAQVFPELMQDQVLEARVDVVDALLDARSGTFGVRLKLANNTHDVISGQKCQVSFTPPVDPVAER